MIRERWPLDGVELQTLKEQHAERQLEDLEINYGIFSISAVCFIANIFKTSFLNL